MKAQSFQVRALQHQIAACLRLITAKVKSAVLRLIDLEEKLEVAMSEQLSPAPADYEIPYDLLGKALSALSGIKAEEIRYKKLIEQSNPFMPEIVSWQVWGADTYSDAQVNEAMRQPMIDGQVVGSHNQFENSPGYLQ